MTKYDDDDAPELTDEVRARARPAREVLPEGVLDAFRRGRGRPPQGARPKTQVSLRLDPDVLEYYRSTGPGWQARVNDVLAREARRSTR